MVTKNRVLFRFIVIFVFLWTIPFPFDIISEFENDPKFSLDFYKKIVPWIGNNILTLENPLDTSYTGSGDKTYYYVLLVFQLFLAVIGTLVWTLLDKKKRDYKKLNYWFLALLRYFLGYKMVVYGAAKIFKYQFPDISFYRLLQPYGNSSPMGLAWTFFGHSVSYNLFMGLAEFIGGILLFHKKTKLLGALILIPVIANIVAVNLFYDIPVKLLSSQLLLVAIIIAAPVLNRLTSVVFFNKATEPVEFFKPFKSKKWTIAKEALKWTFVAYILFKSFEFVLGDKEYGPMAPKPELYGLYKVTDFISNQDTIPPLITDQKRWKYFAIEYNGSIQFYPMNDSRFGLKSEVDTINNKIKLTERDDPDKNYFLHYVKTDSTLAIKGVFREDTIFCQTKRLDKKDFRLTSRGFNWINERPYNK
ncbi:hypothetical protein [Xanthovirga aplysinae]|uniref:hypothetical protein n=1 Tax=Xanthovirga aplysinae TaxID=2529853 RepID=UPI0012BC6821|nr:hypothetical protein [Xanthovirga aplysinae]MTI31419.1 hypothetical protein [Xanthovirga aplysinae]